MLGSAVALNLLFHIPLFWAVIITGFDVLLLLALQRFGMRTIEAVVLLLVATIARLLLHRNFCPAADPAQLSGDGAGADLAASSPGGMIYVAIGIIGATVMPHNLYLHSALVQSRKLQKDEASIRSAIQLQYDRLDRGSDRRFLRQCGHSGAGGDGLLTASKASRCRAATSSTSAPTATGFASPI